MATTLKTLLVDDEKSVLKSVTKILNKKGCEVTTARDVNEALDEFSSEFDLVLMDLKLPDMSGWQLFEKVKQREPDMPVVIISGYGTIPKAVEAIKKGAFNFIHKADFDQLYSTVDELILKKKREQESLLFTEDMAEEEDIYNLISRSHDMMKKFRKVRHLAKENFPVLITGQEGSPIGLFAKGLHLYDRRRRQNDFIEIELSEYRDKQIREKLLGEGKNYFRQAKKGTLHLKDVENLPGDVQKIVLDYIREGRLSVLEPNRKLDIEVRLVFSSTATLRPLANKGEFNQELLELLAEHKINISPLNQRKDDIIPLIKLHAEEYGDGKIENITRGALEGAKQGSWEGNEKELFERVEEAVDNCSGEIIRERIIKDSEVEEYKTSEPQKKKKKEEKKEKEKTMTEEKKKVESDRFLEIKSWSLEDIEREVMKRCLDHFDWNIKKASEKLGISRTTLYSKIDKYSIEEG